jgi:transcription elongation GreA/GreB family factor
VRLESDKGELKEIYLVENAVNLTGFAIATILSPIGQELIGKKVGDSANLNFGKMKIVKIN